MADSAWKDYIDQIIDKYDWNTMAVKHSGECNEAAIFGLDGTGWYWSPGFPDINQTVTVKVEGMTEADTKMVSVNEWETVLAASNGNRQPSEAGIRMGEVKYMMVTHDPATGLAILSCKGGGAAIMKATTCLIVATYTKDKPCTPGADGKKAFQSSGGCAGQVETMANYLKDQGY